MAAAPHLERQGCRDDRRSLRESRAVGPEKPLPRDGRKDARGRSGRLKNHCDNALTGPQSGLYCAPLAVQAAMRRRQERTSKKGPAEG